MFVIAEIGINHNGDVEIAKQLIDMSKSCGADAVKFQKRTIDTVYSAEYLALYRESPWGDTQRAQKEGLEFGLKQYQEIDAYCKKVAIDWFASAWDLESQVFLSRFDLKYNKIASPMIRHLDLLRMVAEEHKHTFISTGMCLKGDIENAIAIFKAQNTPFTLMHCVNKYPCPDDMCKLDNILWLKDTFKCPVGYSNHSTSILAPTVAAVLGAEAIELHITLDRAMYGSDQAASFEKPGLERVVRECHRIADLR